MPKGASLNLDMTNALRLRREQVQRGLLSRARGRSSPTPPGCCGGGSRERPPRPAEPLPLRVAKYRLRRPEARVGSTTGRVLSWALWELRTVAQGAVRSSSGGARLRARFQARASSSSGEAARPERRPWPEASSPCTLRGARGRVAAALRPVDLRPFLSPFRSRASLAWPRPSGACPVRRTRAAPAHRALPAGYRCVHLSGG